MGEEEIAVVKEYIRTFGVRWMSTVIAGEWWRREQRQELEL